MTEPIYRTAKEPLQKDRTAGKLVQRRKGRYRCVLPAIEGFQQEQAFAPGDSLTIEPNRGKIILINKMGE